ncbi:MAG: GntR family transcriptional regulator [Desulfitobacterium sp.]
MATELEIVDKIIAQIRSGKLAPHAKLPSENVIADSWQVPRITARKAYERLEEMGYIYKIQGKGSYVKRRNQQIDLVLSGDVSFTRKMLEKGYHLHTENVFCKRIKYNKKVYDLLEAQEEESIFKVGRLRFIDGQPIALHISYVTQTQFEDIKSVGEEITSMFAYYQSKGYSEFGSKPCILSVTFPTKAQRKWLECSQLTPLLVLESGCIDKRSGKVLDYTKVFYRSDCFSSYVIT